MPFTSDPPGLAEAGSFSPGHGTKQWPDGFMSGFVWFQPALSEFPIEGEKPVTIITRELDQLYLVPLDGATLADVFEGTDLPFSSYCIEHDAIGNAIVKDGRKVVVEVLTDLLGGCLVRVAPMMGDACEMASFVQDQAAADALIDMEEAAARALVVVEQMGGLEARRQKGKWKPISDMDRQKWGMHASHANTQRLRAEARLTKGANDIGKKLPQAA